MNILKKKDNITIDDINKLSKNDILTFDDEDDEYNNILIFLIKTKNIKNETEKVNIIELFCNLMKTKLTSNEIRYIVESSDKDIYSLMANLYTEPFENINNKINIINIILSKFRPNINRQTKNANSLLHILCNSSLITNINERKQLIINHINESKKLNLDIDFNSQNFEGFSVLHYLCFVKECNDVEIFDDNTRFYIIKFIINSIHKNRININLQDNEGYTVLHYLCCTPHIINNNIRINIIKFIIKKFYNEIDFNIIDDFGNTCLHTLLDVDFMDDKLKVDISKIFIDTNKLKLDIRNGNYNNVFDMVIINGCLKDVIYIKNILNVFISNKIKFDFNKDTNICDDDDVMKNTVLVSIIDSEYIKSDILKKEIISMLLNGNNNIDLVQHHELFFTMFDKIKDILVIKDLIKILLEYAKKNNNHIEFSTRFDTNNFYKNIYDLDEDYIFYKSKSIKKEIIMMTLEFNNFMDLHRNIYLLELIEMDLPFHILKNVVNQNGLALQYITKQTKLLCKLAIENNKKAIKYCNKKFLKSFLEKKSISSCCVISKETIEPNEIYYKCESADDHVYKMEQFDQWSQNKDNLNKEKCLICFKNICYKNIYVNC